MKHAALLIACILPLAACKQQAEVKAKDASVAEVTEKVRAAGADQSMVRPGLWQSKVTIDSLEVPGVPPEMSQRMKAMMAERQPHDYQTCLTPEDVKRPKEDFFAGKNNKECRYDHFTMGGGKIDAAMHCGSGSAMQTMQMAGTYSPDAYQMQMSTTGHGKGDEAGMAMKMRVEAHRIGECKATG